MLVHKIFPTWHVSCIASQSEAKFENFCQLMVAWGHQAITWTNVDWSSVKSSDIHIRAISQEMPQPSITKICFKIIYLEFHSNLPGANEF